MRAIDVREANPNTCGVGSSDNSLFLYLDAYLLAAEGKPQVLNLVFAFFDGMPAFWGQASPGNRRCIEGRLV
jgi:hypothetical protein